MSGQLDSSLLHGLLPGEDAFANLWVLMRGAIALNAETFAQINTQPKSLLAALTIVFIAGISQSLSQIVVLFINQVRPIRFILSLLLSALFFVIGYSFWALSTWVILNLSFEGHLSFVAVLRTLGFSYVPLILGVLVMFPYFGSAIFLLLSIWTLLAVVVGIEAITPLGHWDAFESAALGWVVLQLLQKTVGQPIATLGQWITNWAAGEQLITNRIRLAEELYSGLRAQRATPDLMAELERSGRTVLSGRSQRAAQRAAKGNPSGKPPGQRKV
ncbi:MAG: hypothetical protein AAFO06_07040 [Cyanobacteria bacterium J06597_16]